MSAYFTAFKTLSKSFGTILRNPCQQQAAPISLSACCRDLNEFFDDKKNWTVDRVRTGRPWRRDELRIKSNEELHKLWFVLLKEKNMLLTMQHECNAQYELFPSPERIDKVKESMINLEEVVRERNRAYYLLETGETGERPGRLEHNRFGLRTFYKCEEHLMPPAENLAWFRRFEYNRKEVAKFLSLYREKLWSKKRKALVRERDQVRHLLKRYPDLDMEALKEKYPSVDLERIQRWQKVRGHYAP